MAFRVNSRPRFAHDEQECLARVCQAMIDWIASATKLGHAAARTFYALYDDCHAERRALAEACDDAVRLARRLVVRPGEPSPLLELTQSIAGLVNIEFEAGVDGLDAAAFTAAGDARVDAWGARVEGHHRELSDTLAESAGAAPFVQALEKQRLGFQHFAARDLAGARRELAAAVRSWRGEDSSATSGCVACFANPDILAGLAGEVHRRTDQLVDDSHLGVHLAECRHCGQPSVQLFEEDVDWQGGDDAQRYEIIALTADERVSLRDAQENAVQGLVAALDHRRARLVRPAWARSGGESPLGNPVAGTPREPQGEIIPTARSAPKEAVAKPRADEQKPDNRRRRPGRAAQ